MGRFRLIRCLYTHINLSRTSRWYRGEKNLPYHQKSRYQEAKTDHVPFIHLTIAIILLSRQFRVFKKGEVFIVLRKVFLIVVLHAILYFNPGNKKIKGNIFMMFENKQKCLQNKTTHRYRNIIKFKCVKMTIYLLVAEKFLFLLQSPWQKNWNKKLS